jgi:homoserine dehydrogenase
MLNADQLAEPELAPASLPEAFSEAPTGARPELRQAARPVAVLKIGGSVLRNAEDAARVASEAYRFHRQGFRVVAVVSAIAGHTDSLLAEARRTGCSRNNRFTPHLVALGEARAAALAAMACERIGMKADVVHPESFSLLAEGPRESAALRSMDSHALRAALDDLDVAVVPGYVANDSAGRPVLLGRGGTDFTALFLGAHLKADIVRLVKDVPGVFDRDPNIHGAAAQLYDRLSWSEARGVAGKLIQPKALDFAEAQGLAFEVAALGAERATRVGAKGEPARAAPQTRKLRVALAGLGVVGGGVAERLLAERDRFELVSVLVRRPGKARDVEVDASLLTDDPDVLFAANPDLVVDALSSTEAGRALTERAFRIGVSVVSANKQALAGGLGSLQARAGRSKARFGYAACVGGGCPMVETVRAAKAHGEIVSFEAVLNGTMNFMLGRLGQGAGFDTALAEARVLGFAEEDPSADLEGRDAAAKLQLLLAEAFGDEAAPLQVIHPPLDAAQARRLSRLGGDWKQVAVGARSGDKAGGVVRLKRLGAEDDLLRSAVAERNALKVVTADGRVFIAEGRGAGRWPTTEAIWADLQAVRAGLLDA